jgi:CheY-like chemotaxis protein
MLNQEVEILMVEDNVVDLKMPKISGMEVLETVKNDPRTKAIPVVILTSSAEDPDIKKCYALGANSYIVKPVDFNNFSKKIAELGMYWMVVNKFV